LAGGSQALRPITSKALNSEQAACSREKKKCRALKGHTRGGASCPSDGIYIRGKKLRVEAQEQKDQRRKEGGGELTVLGHYLFESASVICGRAVMRAFDLRHGDQSLKEHTATRFYGAKGLWRPGLIK